MATRRAVLQSMVAAGALLKAGAAAPQSGSTLANGIARNVGYKRIATEEAYSTPEVLHLYRQLIDSNLSNDPGFVAMWGAFFRRGQDFFEQLQSLGDRRLSDMDSMGTDVHVLALTAPGVQVFDAATGTAVAKSTNDQLAEACRAHPARFAGLTTIAPQDPANAAKEIERGKNDLLLKGVIVNSHTNDEYLDDQKFWPIFEAAEALNAPIYIHPTTPSPSMVKPWLDRGLHGPLGGFAAEVYLHTLRIIVSGAFDRFPNLKIVLGHMGEGLPYFMYRLDYMQGQAPGLKRKISDYLKENIYVTTSGMAWEPAIKFAQEVLGADRVLYAMDYPYQFDADEVKITDGLAISEQSKKQLYQLNAEQVFSL